jgi:16S rRNA (uracil1498-N3)-methyltransferase
LTSERFFITSKAKDREFVFLEGAEHHHLSKVARIRPGDEVWLFDEEGFEYFARVKELGKEKTCLRILSYAGKKESRIRITLAQALIKSKKMDLVIQKSTELGAHVFIPVISSRSVVKLQHGIAKKLERWKRIGLEAAKQCGNVNIPEVYSPVKLDKFLQKRNESRKMFLSERGGKLIRNVLLSSLGVEPEIPHSVVLLVGPEGGWTDKEERDILDNGFEAVSLGPFTLRSETAAMVSLAMVSHFWNC